MLLEVVEQTLKDGTEKFMARNQGVITNVKIGNLAKLQMLRKGLLKQKLAGAIPKAPKEGTETVNYAWALFKDTLDKKTVWYDSRDPEKEIQQKQYNLFAYKAPLKRSGKLGQKFISTIMHEHEAKTKFDIANNVHIKENETVSVLSIAMRKLQQREDEGKIRKMSQMQKNEFAMRFVKLKDKIT